MCKGRQELISCDTRNSIGPRDEKKVPKNTNKEPTPPKKAKMIT